jgi:HSP20 family protein
MNCCTPKSTATPALRNPFDTLLDGFFGDRLGEVAPAAPLTNIAETKASYVLSFELPGLDEQDIHVQVHERDLTITAERRETKTDEGTTWHRVEQRTGKLARTVRMPEPVAAGAIEATYKQGILTVTVPKKPESQPVRVQIKNA